MKRIGTMMLAAAVMVMDAIAQLNQRKENQRTSRIALRKA